MTMLRLLLCLTVLLATESLRPCRMAPQNSLHSVMHRSMSNAQLIKDYNDNLVDTVDLVSDGSITKQLLAKGTGKKIEDGDILAVEYSARVRGEARPFAKGDKEQFIVKDGSLIKGWDIAISSMTIGEKAKIVCSSSYAYGSAGVKSVIPPDSDIELNIKVLAWLGNQLQPESLFQKDLDIDPFIASTPETIAAEYEEMQRQKEDKYEGGIVQIYLKRLKNISFGFGGSGFFTSQSGERAPWYLNPNLTFPAMITIVVAAFFTVISTGSVRQKGEPNIDIELARVERVVSRQSDSFFG